MRRERQLHVGADFGGLVQNLYFIQHFLPAFCPLDGFFTIEGAQLFDNLLLMLDFPLLIHIGIPFCHTKLFLLHRIVGVVALKGGGFGLVDFNDLGGNAVQKITVVGYDDYGTLVIQQVGFQPVDGVHVQMVGRLVQDN